MSTRDRVRLEATEVEGVALLTVDRPERANALSLEMQAALATLMISAVEDPSVHAVVLTGTGERVFLAGADLKDIIGLEGEEGARRLSRTMGEALARVECGSVPFIAAMGGAAMGGGAEISVACDLRIASERTRLSFRQIHMGIVTAWGGAARLQRLVGPSRARRLLLLGETVDAQEGLAMGLFDEVVPHERVLSRAIELAGRLATLPPLAVRGMRQLLSRLPSLDPEEAMAYERDTFAGLWTTEDREEAMSAFLARRPPRWRGR